MIITVARVCKHRVCTDIAFPDARLLDATVLRLALKKVITGIVPENTVPDIRCCPAWPATRKLIQF
jgi:hypothetical protein